MKKIIVFGSIIACFLMLLVPNISAIEFRSIKENTTDYNENELIDALKVRIEQLKAQNPDPKMTLKGDPDGPFKGGLDDPKDWADLFSGIMSGFFIGLIFKNHLLMKAIASGDIYDIVTCILDYEIFTWALLTTLGDAFDIIDPDGDGY